MPRVKLDFFPETIPGAMRLGKEIFGFVEQHKEWIADGDPKSETVHRYRTLLRSMKEVWRLARIEPDAYHPSVVREKKDGVIAGLATVHTGRAIQHPDMSHFLTGADIDYTLRDGADDETHLETVRALLGAVGRLTVRDSLAGNSRANEAAASAVVLLQHMDGRNRGFELACEAGEMVRIEGPASLTVPEAYAHPLIDFAKGGQPAQLYYAAEMPSPRHQ